MSEKQSDIKIHGTIRRRCEKCDKNKECNCLCIDGKAIILCRECTDNQYKTKKRS